MTTLIDPTQILGGVATGGINYITNNLAEVDTSPWVTYADAAGVAPVDGIGGSPAVTWTRNTSSPLRGVADFLFTKDAVNRQGQGFSVDFTVNRADSPRPIYVSFDYITSANYADDDIRIWIYDVTNAALIQPAPYLLKKVNTPESFTCVFQTPSNSTSFRLIGHVGSTSALSFTCNFDNFKVGPSYAVMGSPVTDAKSWTPTISNMGTIANLDAKYWRVGGECYFRIVFTQGTGSAAAATITLPVGIDTSRLNPDGKGQLGTWYNTNNLNFGSNNLFGAVFQDSSTTPNVLFISRGGNIPTFAKMLGNDLAANSGWHIEGHYPAQGWLTSVLMSDNADSRVCAARYYGSTQTWTNSLATYNCPTKDFDTHSAVSGGIFTAPLSGIYRVSVGIQITSANTITLGNGYACYLAKNGSFLGYLASYYHGTLPSAGTPQFIAGTVIIQANAGDTLQGQLIKDTNASTTTVAGGQSSFIQFERISGPAQIAATESVYCQAYKDTSLAVANGGGQVTWALDRKAYDSHGSFDTSTNRYYVPCSGLYRLTIGCSTTGTSTGQVGASFIRNGNAIRQTHRRLFEDNGALTASTAVKCLAGDYLQVYWYNYGTASINILGGVNASGYAYSVFEIERIGNY